MTTRRWHARRRVLKDWRSRRRMSQLDLGLSANVSARHISFLETGRARPTRTMVLQLSATLEVPRPDRNALLDAAGFARLYESRSLDAGDMAHVRAAVEWMLARHDPLPAMALDRHWSLTRMNAAAAALLGAVGLAEGDSLLDSLCDGEGLRAAILNWDEVARHLGHRLRTESAHLGGDPLLDAAAGRLARSGSGRPPAPEDGRTLPAVIPVRYRAGESVLSFFSTIAQFGTAEDIALADLRIELLFPADEATSAVYQPVDASDGRGGRNGS